MIKIEQDSKQDSERNRNENIPYTYIPEVDKPASIDRRKEGLASRQRLQINISHPPNMHEPSKEHHRERGAVILDEYTDIVLEERARSYYPAEISYYEDEERDDY